MLSLTNLPSDWYEALQNEAEKPYFKSLVAFVEKEYKEMRICPASEDIFAAFHLCPLKKVKVVIIGQDPYHGEGQAHGLSFSVRPGVAQPPSLRNIVKLAIKDAGIPETTSGDLTAWAKQGVLLLNSVLTVRRNDAASHSGEGWEEFTDAVIAAINRQKHGVVYMLWGKYAQEKGELLDWSKNCVLTAVHPSPLSAHRGFMDCAHFSKANEYLKLRKRRPIDWSV